MKKLAVVLAALMMLTSTTVLANESGNTGDNSLTPGYTAVEIATPDEILTQAKEEAADAAQVSDAEKVEVLAVYMVNGAPGSAVTVAVPDVKKGDTVVVLHWGANGWENDTVSNVIVEDGKVTATYAELSPVAFVRVAKAVETPNIYYWLASPFAGATTLPKTGVVAVLPVAAMACLAGAVACGRKEK